LGLNGKQAITFFEDSLDAEEPFNLVLLDIVMPIMDGLEALKKMRAAERRSEVPIADEAFIIMITTLDTDHRKIFRQEGCDGYITKPVRRIELLEMLKVYGLIEP